MKQNKNIENINIGWHVEGEEYLLLIAKTKIKIL